MPTGDWAQITQTLRWDRWEETRSSVCKNEGREHWGIRDSKWCCARGRWVPRGKDSTA